MFSKKSRYYPLPEQTIENQDGPVTFKSLRLTSPVQGDFQHTVESTDRVDMLAQKFYKNSHYWWRICDANPSFDNPQSLLGKDSRVVQKYYPEVTGVSVNWAELLGFMRNIPGIIDCLLDEISSIRQENRTIPEGTVEVNVFDYKPVLLITYNPVLLDQFAILGFLNGKGYLCSQPEVVNRIGKKITIPPIV